VIGNTFQGNRDALGAVSTDRGTSALHGLRETANLFVDDNSFVLTTGAECSPIWNPPATMVTLARGC